MTVTVPQLKNHKPVLVAPSIQTYYPKPWTWRDHLQALEQKHNIWIHTRYGPHKPYTHQDLSMEAVNELMQHLYPGPYRVVERLLPDQMVWEFSLKFSDPQEQTLWLLRWS